LQNQIFGRISVAVLLFLTINIAHLQIIFTLLAFRSLRPPLLQAEQPGSIFFIPMAFP
jgi:hypothetical protein